MPWLINEAMLREAQLVWNETRMTLLTSELSNLYRTVVQRTKMQIYVEGSTGVDVEW